MKTYIIILLTLFSVNLNAQIQDANVRSLDLLTEINDPNKNVVGEKNKYYKDLNNRLDYFIGNWFGSYNDKTLSITNLKRKEPAPRGKSIDVIVTKYKITSSTGEVLVNTLNLDPMLRGHINGFYFVDYDYTIYKSWYEGEQADCNQTGWVMMEKINENSFKLWVEPSVEILPYGCPDGDLHILPTSEEEAVVMTKQN